MINTKYLLVYVVLPRNDLRRIALAVDGDLWEEQDMIFYRENNALKDYMKLDEDCNILSVEDIDGIVTKS